MPKISELTDLASLADADDTVIVDDTDDTTKRTGMDAIASYMAVSSIFISGVSTVADDSFELIAQDLSATSGTVTLTSPDSTSVLAYYNLTNPDTSGGTTVEYDNTGKYLLVIYNNSAYNITIEDPSGGAALLQPGVGGVTNFVLASNEVFFGFIAFNACYGIYVG
jgi:hypothetical protein